MPCQNRNNSRMPGSMLILTWVGIIFVIILHRAKASENYFLNNFGTILLLYLNIALLKTGSIIVLSFSMPTNTGIFVFYCSSFKKGTQNILTNVVEILSFTFPQISAEYTGDHLTIQSVCLTTMTHMFTFGSRKLKFKTNHLLDSSVSEYFYNGRYVHYSPARKTNACFIQSLAMLLY